MKNPQLQKIQNMHSGANLFLAMVLLGAGVAIAIAAGSMAIIFAALGFGGALFASLKIVDTNNTRNTLPLALIIGAVFAIAAPFAAGPFAILPLVALLYLLVKYYELGLIGSMATVITMHVVSLIVASVIPGVG